jgi:L-alanine-DL-glutamate epimerase-like enolase superfamily enzyme
MRVTSIEVRSVAMDLPEPLRWGLFAVSRRGACLLLIRTDEGITGIGECGFSVDAAPMIEPIVRILLAPLVIGRDPFEVEAIWEAMYTHTHKWGRRGLETYAMSGIDIALWDIIGKASGQPLYRLFGGYRRTVPAYSAPALKDPEVVEQETATAVAQGFEALKLRFGLGPEKDREILKAARKAAGPTTAIMVDANMAYEFREALELSRFLADQGVCWLEEPIRTRGLPQYLREHARLRTQSPIPISGAECLLTRYEVTEAVAAEAFDIYQPDAAGVGGISEMRKIAGILAARDLRFIPHIACSSVGGVGLAANLHIICSSPNTPYVEYDAYDSPIRREIFREPILAKHGQVTVPDRPGLGLELDESAVARYQVA